MVQFQSGQKSVISGSRVSNSSAAVDSRRDLTSFSRYHPQVPATHAHRVDTLLGHGAPPIPPCAWGVGHCWGRYPGGVFLRGPDPPDALVAARKWTGRGRTLDCVAGRYSDPSVATTSCKRTLPTGPGPSCCPAAASDHAWAAISAICINDDDQNRIFFTLLTTGSRHPCPNTGESRVYW